MGHIGPSNMSSEDRFDRFLENRMQILRGQTQPAQVNIERANIQELNNNQDAETAPSRRDCKKFLYCKRQTNSRYKRNRQNIRNGRAGKIIGKWVLTKR